MIVAGTALVTLVFWLVVLRGASPQRIPIGVDSARAARGSRGAWLAVVGGVVLAHYPVLAALPGLVAHGGVLSGDAATHAAVSAAIARRGIAHGWLDVYNGGFPFGVHYPWLAWLLPAGLVRAGAPPGAA